MTPAHESMDGFADVVIVGAGPYGLSIAAHLRAANVDFRILGIPMQLWRERMPNGMLLKSDGFASNLSDPAAVFTLEAYCRLVGIPYHHTRRPVEIDTFREYGLAFQREIVPEVDERLVTRLRRQDDGYVLEVEGGSTIAARRVVLAVGLGHFEHLPPRLARLPKTLCTHSSAHRDLSRFRGLDVVVIGGGASAIDTAALLKEVGANVVLLTRRRELKIAGPPEPDSMWRRLRHPQSMIGPGWKARFFTDAPGLFRYLPTPMRVRIVKKFLGPAAGYPMRDRFTGKVPVMLQHHLRNAAVINGRVHLMLDTPHGPSEQVADHVIAATGYLVDLNRLTFIDPDVRASIRLAGTMPRLSSTFESSSPGLYFVGISAANTFGPMMRFACGADWTARRIARALTRSALRDEVEPATQPAFSAHSAPGT